jgi:2-keto-3-deoxy-L-rhamnonate aldolase RhmA
MISPTYGQNAMQLQTIRRIKTNQITFGAWIYLKDPAVTEMIAEAGYDWVIIDMEHGNLNEDLAQNLMVPLKGSKCVPIVRLPSRDVDLIKKVLDTGAMGIMVPLVESAEHAEQVVQAVKYPPAGIRGMGYGRAEGWGQKALTYYRQANETTLVVLTVESTKGVENINQITKVSGADVIFAGTYDLAASLGLPGQFDHPLVIEGTRKMLDACKKSNITFGCDASTCQAIHAKLNEGAAFIALTVDTDLVWQGAEKLLGDATVLRDSK